MPTIISHAVVASAIGLCLPREILPWRMVALGAALAMAPDLDVVGFALGIPYDSFWGHRGFWHSLPFAIVVAVAFGLAMPHAWGRKVAVIPFLCLALASHGLLDAATDGGLGIALFSPFEQSRWFLPCRPIAVAPIGSDFVSREAIPVVVSELLWLWLPSTVLIAAVSWLRHRSVPPP